MEKFSIFVQIFNEYDGCYITGSPIFELCHSYMLNVDFRTYLIWFVYSGIWARTRLFDFWYLLPFGWTWLYLQTMLCNFDNESVTILCDLVQTNFLIMIKLIIEMCYSLSRAFSRSKNGKYVVLKIVLLQSTILLNLNIWSEVFRHVIKITIGI